MYNNIMKKEPLSLNEIDEIRYNINIKRAHRYEIFNDYSPNIQAIILVGLSKNAKKEILENLEEEGLLLILDNLDPDDANHIIDLLPKKRREEIIPKLEKRLSEGVDMLRVFGRDSAGVLMNLDYIQVEADSNFENVLEKFKKHEEETGKLPLVTVSDAGELKGYLPVHQLVLQKKNEKIHKHISKIRTVSANIKQKELLRIFINHPHDKVAVLNENKNIVGIIYSDDVLKILKDKESSLSSFAGVNKEETINDSFKVKIKHRYKWLFVNLFTAFLAAFTVSLFDNTISKYIFLAVYMPMVSGMGGNAGTQTLAVLVRGLSFENIKVKDIYFVLKNEILAGFFNGFMNGIIVAGIVYLLNHDLRLSLVLFLAMIMNLIVASIFGTMIPLVMKRLGKDPASSATVFITTATDVLGFIAFLGLATLIF
jgi:magnesium transporter